MNVEELRMNEAANSLREVGLHSAEAWAENVHSQCSDMTHKVMRLCEQIHEAAAADDATRVFELEARVVNTLTWGLANMSLDAPARHAALVAPPPKVPA